MRLVLFVANAATTAHRPDDATNNLRLTLPPKSDNVDDANGDAFPDASKKSALVEIQGLSDELQAAFRGGQRVTVTIDVAQ